LESNPKEGTFNAITELRFRIGRELLFEFGDFCAQYVAAAIEHAVNRVISLVLDARILRLRPWECCAAADDQLERGPRA
jgi:hypothetical protein